MNLASFTTNTQFLYAIHTTRKVLREADTTTIRIILAAGSAISALGLLIDDDKFLSPAYRIVSVFGTERMWAIYFMLHFAGVFWRICLDPVPRPRWAIAINLFGFLIWFISTAALCWAVGSVGIATSLAFVMCAASAWALYRTGMRKEIVTP